MAATANAREVIGEATLGELESTLRGRLIRPSDPDYDQARLVWNAAHDRRPALIIRCAGTADVMRAVEFARSEGLQLAVRSGAHSIAGYSTYGGVVIDISSMKGIRVDPIARRAVAQAGLTWAEFDHETQAFGLAVTGGLVSSTGIAGFTLGGGIGWLLREYGLTCDSLPADVVTADGQLVTASEHEHPDLFWALRGGGTFGVVTSMEFRLLRSAPVATRDVFSEDELAQLRGFPSLAARNLIRFFTLAAADEAFLRKFRGRDEVLGAAVQLCTLPWLGFVPDNVAPAPVAAVARLWQRLGIPIAEAARLRRPGADPHRPPTRPNDGG